MGELWRYQEAAFSTLPHDGLALGLVDSEERTLLAESGVDGADGEALAPARVRRDHPRARRLRVDHHRVAGLEPGRPKATVGRHQSATAASLRHPRGECTPLGQSGQPWATRVGFRSGGGLLRARALLPLLRHVGIAFTMPEARSSTSLM